MGIRGAGAVALASLLSVATVATPSNAADPNTPPIAVDDPNPGCQVAAFGGKYPIPEDPKETAVLALACGPLANDTDADGDHLVPELVADAEHGTAMVWGDPVGTFNFASYLPDDDFNTGWGDQPGGSWDSDRLTYRVTDGTDWSNVATYRVWIAPVNDAPTFTPGPDVVQVGQDSGAYSGQWATDVDPGPYEAYQHVHFEVTHLDVTGVPNLFAVAPSIDDDGVLTFTPAVGEIGLAKVTVDAFDDGGLEDWGMPSQLRELPDDTSDEVTFEIVVMPDTAPDAVDDNLSIAQGAGPTSATVLENDSDPDGDAVRVIGVTQGANGAVAITGGGSAVSYDPTGLYSGPDSFSYTLSDGRGGTDTATVNVTVAADSTPPTTGSLIWNLPPQAIGATTVNVTLGWSGHDAGSGVAGYRVERRIGSGAWTRVATSQANARSVTTTLSLGTAYGYRVRATDAAGNVGPWATFPTLTPRRVQDTSARVRYTGAWTRIRGSSLSGGSARYARSSTRRARLAFTGHEIAVVATRRTTGGTAAVFVDGVRTATINLDAAGTRYRRVVFRRSFASGGPHEIEIRPLGDGRVELDAFIVLR